VSRDLARMMTNTTGGVSPLYCQSCREERLHKHGVCGKCGTRFEAPKANLPPTYAGLRSNRMDALRGRK
jgi:hypothetical protein